MDDDSYCEDDYESEDEEITQREFDDSIELIYTIATRRDGEGMFSYPHIFGKLSYDTFRKWVMKNRVNENEL